ncbi:MAG: hypothetical protein WAM85_06010 [Terracidiphilus sp.]
MKRREPPPLATWTLEHLTPGDRDEALAGDLLEAVHTGRSSGWYWRQVLAICVISWARSLRARLPLLVFSLLWSMLAPAWMIFVNRLGEALTSGWIWRLSGVAGPLPVLTGFILWTFLNSSFLWIGMLLYSVARRSFGQVTCGRDLIRAMRLAPLVFLPSIGTTFVLMNLYSFPGLTMSRLAATPVGQVADLGMPADVLRIPYLIALLCALWRLVPRAVRSSQPIPVESTPIEVEVHSDTLALFSTVDPFTLKRFFGFMVGAGLTNAMIGGFLLCRLPQSPSPGLVSLLIRAIAYVAVGVVAGVVGTWLYWRNPSSPFRQSAPLPFTLFALVCAAGWVWAPSMAIFSEQISAATAFVAMIGAFVLASGLRGATYFAFAPAQTLHSTFEMDDVELFAESLHRPPLEIHGYLIAISLYGAGAALLTHSMYTASALLALSAFLFAWNRTVPRNRPFHDGDEVRRAALRLARVAIPAVLVTVWALLDGVAHRNSAAQANTAFAGNGNSAAEDGQRKSVRQVSGHGLSGYESVILWPYPEKKQIVPPLRIEDSLLAPGTRQPVTIRFNGPYWIVQPPDKRPGPTAHLAHGTPAAVDIQSNNTFPLVMDAHQNLSTPIRVARCREIQVEIENRDNRAGAISLGLLLADETSRHKQTLYLGQQPIVTTEPGHFSFKRSPVFETLRFSVPPNASLKKFSEITVLVLPDIEHTFVAPKIAILQFQLFPR